MPERIRMSPQRPWRADNPDAVIVARPSTWGNPFKVGSNDAAALGVVGGTGLTVWLNAPQAVAAYRAYLREQRPDLIQDARDELAGRDLCCWCPLDRPCHADVLLELANERIDA